MAEFDNEEKKELETNEEVINGENEEELHVWTEEDLKENQKMMKKSNWKVRTFLVFVFLIIVFFFAFQSNELFIFSFSSSDENVSSSSILLNFLSYTLIISAFLYMFYYFVYFKHRKQLTEEEQMSSFHRFKKQFNLFDLLGVIPIFLAVLTLINGLFFGFATVIGPSMEPTFCPDDYVIIDHFTNSYERDDIMIFMHDGSKLIKRVIAVPGDTLVVNDEGVFVNGVREETYFPGTSHFAYDGVVPEGYFFVMGDNRYNSNDSRSFGFVSPEKILGEVVFQIGGNSCGIS